MTVDGLDDLLSAEGWPYASSAAVSAQDPGRFHCLFGRDSLVTSLAVLPVRPEVARATVRALAARQGRRLDPFTLEEPGKIGHEFRDRPPDSFVAHGWPSGERFDYYASADATSWFLIVLAALDDPALAEELRPHWQAASRWLLDRLDAGDGLIWHEPGARPGGLAQQGWRDTQDPTGDEGAGILRPDGTLPNFPLADADTQAVTVAALRAVGHLTGSVEWTARSDRMRAQVSAQFLPDVMAVEAGGQPVRGAGSQLGWMLWTGAVEPDLVTAAAQRLCAPDILTPSGLRTLSSAASTFADDAYHRGSVWPFDSWLGWGGLRAAGYDAQAEQLRRGVMSAIDQLGLYPELYAVDRGGRVRGEPISNRHQAWTVGARWAMANEWDGRPI